MCHDFPFQIPAYNRPNHSWLEFSGEIGCMQGFAFGCTMRWKCTKCGKLKGESKFYKHKLNSKNGLTSHCKDCINEYMKNSMVRIRRWKDRTRDVRNKYQRERNHRLRETFLEMYGNKCVCCGETWKEFLVIDHVKGQHGKKRRDAPNEAYSKAIKKYAPRTYRILCSNCNHATSTGQKCPHKLRKNGIRISFSFD